MNHEDVIQLAREAGFVVDEDSRQYQSNCISHTWYLIDEGLERFANAIEQRTLEMAAQEWDDLNAPPAYGVVETSSYEVATIDCAAAIRALGEKA